LHIKVTSKSPAEKLFTVSGNIKLRAAAIFPSDDTLDKPPKLKSSAL